MTDAARYRGRPIVTTVVLANVFLMLLGQGVLAPVLPEVKAGFNASYIGISWAVTAFALGRIVTDLGGGVLAARAGSRLWLIAAGSAVTVAGTAISAFSGTLELFTVGRAIAGLGSGLCTTIGLTLILDDAPQGRVGRAASYYWSALTAGAFFGPGFGGIVSLIGGWRLALGGAAIAAGLSMLTLVIVACLPRRPQVASSEHAPPAVSTMPVVSAAVRHRVIWAAFGGVMALFFIRGGVQQTLAPLAAAEIFGVSPVLIAALLMTGAGASSLLSPFAGAWADRVGRKPVLIAAVAALAVGTVMVSISSITATFAVGVVIGGLAGASSGVPPALISDVATGAKRARLLGLYRFAGDVALLCAPLVVGYGMTHFGFQISGLILAAVVLLAFVPILRLPAYRRPTAG